MIREIAVYPLFGTPLAIVFGIMAVFSFVSTGILGYAMYRQNNRKLLRWHLGFAISSFVLVAMHLVLIESIFG